MKIGIIGAGNVGGALGRQWAQQGHEVTFGVRDPNGDRVRALLESMPAGVSAKASGLSEAAASAEIVFLTTPWDGTESAVRALGELGGKVLVDCTNPLGPDLSLVVGHSTSGAETVAGWATGARVVKAFNTTGANNMAAPNYGDRRPAMFVCGDDPEARSLVAGLADELGFEPVDCGPLANARLLEPLAGLWIWLAFAGGQDRDFAFALLRR